MGGFFAKTRWRSPGREEWTPEEEDKLVKDIQNIDKGANDKDKKIIKPHVVLCGPNNAGKSSFMNSAIGILKGQQSNISNAGASHAEEVSLTQTYTRVAAPAEFNSFRLSDTPGLLEPIDRGLRIEDIEYLVKGHIKPGYRFQDGKSIDDGNDNFVTNPTDDEKVHCLVFVFDVTTFGLIHSNYEKKIRQIIKILNEKGIPFVVVLTKIDMHDKKVDEDIREMHESAKVNAAKKEVNKKFKVQERDVFPVVNLVNDPGIKRLSKIPHLLALKTMLTYAGDYIDNHIYVNR